MILKGNVDETLALATLASNTLLGALFDETPDETVFALSLECTWSMAEHTPAEGPIVVGVAHGDYTDAEIEAVIENTGSWDRGDLVQQEVARRKVRIVGVFDGLLSEEKLNDGLPIKTVLKFEILTGKTLRLFAYNRDASSLTTGSLILINGHVWLKPR